MRNPSIRSANSEVRLWGVGSGVRFRLEHGTGRVWYAFPYSTIPVAKQFQPGYRHTPVEVQRNGRTSFRTGLLVATWLFTSVFYFFLFHFTAY